MKKRTIKLAMLSLMMTAMLFNCKDKDDKDPTKPDDAITKELDNLNVAVPTLQKAALPSVTPSSVEQSAKATEVNGALAGIAASGTVPASVSSAAADVKGALSPSEISTLSGVSSETINAVAAGGTLSPELKAVLDKVMANPALAAYLPKFNFPIVNGTTLRGARLSSDAASAARTSGSEATEQIEKVESVLVDDACTAAAEATFATAKTRLDGQRATAVAAVTAQYNADIAPIAAAQASCVSNAPTTAAGYRTLAQQAAASANASLDAAQATLGDIYPILKALVNIQLLGALSSINTLQAADSQACVAIANASTTNAQAAQTANLAAVTAAYTTALAQATKLKGDALLSCHNQGGGN